MKKIIVLLALSSLAACSSVTPLIATSNPVSEKEGVSCYDSIFGFPISRDAGLYTAATNGKIKKISTVDIESFTAIVYNSTCTVVRGE